MISRRVVGPILLVVVWFVVAEARWISPLFLPKPFEVVTALWVGLVNGPLIQDLFQSTMWTMAAFVIGTILGMPLGIMMGQWKAVGDLFEVTTDFFRSLPVIVLFPLFMVFFGIGTAAKVAAGAFAAGLIVLISAWYGVKNSRGIRKEMARSFGATPWQVFKLVTIWDALPLIVSGLRMGISMALIIVLVTEMFFGTDFGLGRRIYDAGLLYRMPEMFANIILAGALGFFLNRSILLLENRKVDWGGK